MKNKISFFVFHFALFLMCLLAFCSGCGSIKSKRVEVMTGSNDVWTAKPSQSVNVKVVCEL
jgi:hypothetical protein